MKRKLVAPVVAGVLLAGIDLVASDPTARAADTTSCTRFINAVPFTIYRPGYYCLNRDVATSINSGFAILVTVDNVTVDLGGHTLDGSAAGLETLARGIGADNLNQVAVRNGTVRGFFVGVYLAGEARGADLTVEKIRAQANTGSGIVLRSALRGHVVRDNVVTDTGGKTSSLGPVAGIAIAATASVINNDVVNTFGGSGTPTPAYGIAFFGPVPSDYQAVAVNNRVTRSADAGFDCSQAPGAEVVLRDNIVLGAPTPYSGTCTLVGATNHP